MKKRVTKNNKRIKLISLIVLVAIWFTFVSYFFYNSTKLYEEEQIEDSLIEITDLNSNSVEFLFKKYTNFLTLTTDFFREIDFNNINDFEKIFNDLSDIENFLKIVITMPPEDNISYESNGERLIISDYKYTSKMDSRRIFLSDVFVDERSQKEVVSINVPMISPSGEFLAYITGVLTVEELSNVFSDLFYNLDGYFHIIDSNGKYVAVSNSDMMLQMDSNFFDAVSNDLIFFDGYSSSDVLKAFDYQTKGLTKYSNLSGEESRIASYSPIDINSWMMYSVVDNELVVANIQHDLQVTLIFIIAISMIVLLLIILTNKSQKELLVKAQESERKLRFVSNKINKYFIEINFARDEVKMIGDYKNLFNRKTDITILSDDMRKGFLHSEDTESLYESFEQVMNGKTLSDLKIRVQGKDGEYLWCALSLFPVDNKNNHQATSAIGLLEDIDDLVKETLKLKKNSEIDILSQLYNKGTTEKLIKEIIKNSRPSIDHHVLFIIDLDNFKSINDTFGHKYGDNVIKEIASELKILFRNEDIVGRIGGDEFCAFMQNVTSESLITRRAMDICNSLQRTYTDGTTRVEISSSIGIASYSQNGVDFDTLYKRADLALYDAKEHGKRTFVTYSGQIESNYQSNRTIIDSDKKH